MTQPTGPISSTAPAALWRNLRQIGSILVDGAETVRNHAIHLIYSRIIDQNPFWIPLGKEILRTQAAIGRLERSRLKSRNPVSRARIDLKRGFKYARLACATADPVQLERAGSILQTALDDIKGRGHAGLEGSLEASLAHVSYLRAKLRHNRIIETNYAAFIRGSLFTKEDADLNLAAKLAADALEKLDPKRTFAPWLTARNVAAQVAFEKARMDGGIEGMLDAIADFSRLAKEVEKAAGRAPWLPVFRFPMRIEFIVMAGRLAVFADNGGLRSDIVSLLGKYQEKVLPAPSSGRVQDFMLGVGVL
jgi:hypothetical protein